MPQNDVSRNCCFLVAVWLSASVYMHILGWLIFWSSAQMPGPMYNAACPCHTSVLSHSPDWPILPPIHIRALYSPLLDYYMMAAQFVGLCCCWLYSAIACSRLLNKAGYMKQEAAETEMLIRQILTSHPRPYSLPMFFQLSGYTGDWISQLSVRFVVIIL